MYRCIVGHVRRFVEDNDIGLPRWSSKPIYIDDAFNHIDVSGARINVKKFFLLSRDGVKSRDVFRFPIVGIYTESGNVNRVLTLFSRSLDINAINIGTMYSGYDVDKIGRLCDILLVSGFEMMPGSIKVPWLSSTYVSSKDIGVSGGLVLCWVEDPSLISLISTLLYFIRPLYHILGGSFLSYPLEYVGVCDDNLFTVEAVNGDNEVVSSIEELFGFRICCGGSVFIEIIDI
jgi:hypothetical protein